MQNRNTTPGRLRSAITEQSCPSCAATIPVHHGYVTWCECGWNLKPYEPAPPASLYERMRMRLSERMGEEIFESLARAESLDSSFTLARATAYALAAPIHLITLLFGALGVFLLIWGWPHVLGVCFGAVCLLGAWYTRPRLGRFPKKSIASRAKYPTLYAVVDEVADALGAKRIDGIIFSDRYNASMSRLGMRGRTLLTLGIPLMAMLSDEERVSLIGHEIGHTANGDCTRLIFIRGAMISLALWHDVVLPDGIILEGYGYVGLAMIPVNLGLYGLAGILRGWLYCLVHLLFRESQRAEYLADYMAAEVAGTEAGISDLAKIDLLYLYEYCVQRAATNGGRPLFEELEHQLSVLPARELERLRRVAMLDRSRIDATHPPTGKRIAFLQARHRGEAKVTIGPERSGALAQELAQTYPAVEKEALDTYTRGLYR